MWILPLVGYLGSILGFCFLTLSIASGLYYLSEVVEEHTVIAKRLLTKLIYSIMGLQLLLCIADGFPLGLTLLGIFSHFIYLGNMRRFPFVKLTDPLFLVSCVLVLANHYVWFRHFSHRQQQAYRTMTSYYDHPDSIPSFTEIASYFGLCVWLVPFALFISLSASDNVLPTMGSETPQLGGHSPLSPGGAGETARRRGQGMAKAVVDNVRAAISGIGAVAGRKRPENRF